MAISPQENADVPMATRMQRVLAAIKQMGPQERVELLVQAGLMTNAEAQSAIARLTRSKKHPGKSNSDR